MYKNIKICHLNQLAVLRELSIETYHDTFTDSNSDEVMQAYFDSALSMDKLHGEVINPASTFYFIYDQQEIAGYLKVNETTAQTDIFDEKALEIERIYIRNRFFRKGLGKQLLQFALHLAEQAEKQYIWLGVWEDNTAALHFYQNMGFYQIGEHPFDMGGDIQTDLILRKDLILKKDLIT